MTPLQLPSPLGIAPGPSIIGSKEYCFDIIDASGDYFMHHKMLMLSKPYHDWYLANKEQRDHELRCRYQRLEYFKDNQRIKRVFYVGDVIHRIGDEDLPAVEMIPITRFYSDTKEEWYRRGKLHRIKGPAIVHANGEEWFLNGKRHRLRGPAYVSTRDDTVQWYLNGKLHRHKGPANVTRGREEWYLNGKLHREGGPALVHGEDWEEWYWNGKLHREDGPAVIHGEWKEWWRRGIIRKNNCDLSHIDTTFSYRQ